MSSLGVYFGPKSTKIVESKGKRIITNTQILQSTLETGGLEEKVPTEVKTIELVALFKDELRKNKVDAKEACVSLSGRDLIIRTFEVPNLPKEELHSAIIFETKKYIPFKMEELVSDFQVHFDRKTATNIVLFAGIKKDILDKYVSLFSQLDIKISGIEYSVFSVLRSLLLSGVKEKGVIAVLGSDLKEEDEISFTVLEDSFPLFSRDISLGNIPEVGVRPLEGEASDESGHGLLDKLKTEIRLSFDYYNRKFPTKNIKKLLLLCNQEYRAELEAFVRELGISVQFVDATRKIDRNAAYSLGLLKALGSSLNRVIRTEIKLNLLLAKERLDSAKKQALITEKAPLLEGIRIDFRFIFLGLVLCALTFGYGLYKIDPVKRELDNTINSRPKVISVNIQSTLEELRSIDAKYKRKLQDLNRAVKGQFYVTYPLNVIPKSMPDGLWLTGLSFNSTESGNELVLQGKVYLTDSNKEFEALNQFTTNLRQNPEFSRYFKDITINSVDRGQYRDVKLTNFSISCKAYQERRE